MYSCTYNTTTKFYAFRDTHSQITEVYNYVPICCNINIVAQV